MPTVSIKSKSLEFEVQDGSIIFDALDKQGHELPHGCLAGSCGACRIKIVEGSDNLSEMSQIESNTVDAIITNYRRIHGSDYLREDTIRLSCRAKVKGYISIETIN